MFGPAPTPPLPLRIRQYAISATAGRASASLGSMLVATTTRSEKRRRRCGHPARAADDDDDNDADDDGSIVCLRNSVYFYADVTKRTVLRLVQKLHEANEYATKGLGTTPQQEVRVYLYINSPGGEVFAGLSAMDHIRWNPVPVVTVVDGFVASSATFLLLGAAERKAMRNARILIHQLTATFWGKFVDLLDEVKNTQELMRSIQAIYTQGTRMDTATVEELLR